MKCISYSCVFIGKINEIHILINEKIIQEIPTFKKNIPGYISVQNQTAIPGIKPQLQRVYDFQIIYALMIGRISAYNASRHHGATINVP